VNIPSIESLLKKYHLRPKKKLGQHFLNALPTLEKIVNALGAKHTDDVLEIGAGLGVMTAMLASRAHRIFAVEKDTTLSAIIEKEFGHLENLQLITNDVLKINFRRDLGDARFPIKVIGNIPYNISTPILFKLLDNRPLLQCAVLTVQQEVAKRITARPNTKDYGILAILSQTQADCRKLFDIRPTNFIPPPEVDSSVVRLDFVPSLNWGIESYDLFQKIVKAAFNQRRKTLRNSLLGSQSLGLSAAKLDSALSRLKIDPIRRPETLLIAEYIELANQLL
jgi:16S rRNA (adenine1518-N6/adenine1519-N6)-dimethyltransferase